MVSFRLLSKLWRAPPVPTWSSPKPCCPVSPGLQETARTTRRVLTSSILRGESSQQCFSTAWQYQPICTPRHSSSLQSNIFNTSCSVSTTSNHTRCTVDKNSRQNLKQPATLSLPPPGGQKEIDRRSAVLLADTWTKTCCSFPFESLVRALLLDNWSCSQRPIESTPSARTASVHSRDILPLTPKSP